MKFVMISLRSAFLLQLTSILALALMAFSQAKWKVSFDGPPTTQPIPTSTAEQSTSPTRGSASSNPPNSIRLIDWHSWKMLNASAVERRVGAAQQTMLIVASDEIPAVGTAVAHEEASAATKGSTSSTTTSSPPTSLPPITSPSTTTIPPAAQMTTTPFVNSPTTTALPALPTLPLFMLDSNKTSLPAEGTPPPVDLRGLPILMALLKQLTQLPSMIRSFTSNSPTSLLTQDSLGMAYVSTTYFINAFGNWTCRSNWRHPGIWRVSGVGRPFHPHPAPLLESTQ